MHHVVLKLGHRAAHQAESIYSLSFWSAESISISQPQIGIITNLTIRPTHFSTRARYLIMHTLRMCRWLSIFYLFVFVSLTP